MPLTVALPLRVHEPPSTRHSACDGEVASFAVTGKLTPFTPPLIQLELITGVVLSGSTESMRTNSSTQSVQVLVTESRARWVKRMMPSAVTVAVPDAPLTVIALPQLTLYSKASTLEPASGMSTEPAGVPTCHALMDTTVWSWEAGA